LNDNNIQYDLVKLQLILIISFNKEYNVPRLSYIICGCDMPKLLADNILALPWQNLSQVFGKLE